MHYSIISTFFVIIVIHDVAGSILRDTGHSLGKRDTFQWGVVGDSWASGVAYLDPNAYDDNTSGCMRITESYGAQLQKDTSWTNGWTEDFSFPACSGSRLFDIARGQRQIENIGSSPRLAVMTSGGNNALFFRVVNSCVYHSDWYHDYGPRYADDVDKIGDCARAINDSSTYIQKGLAYDITVTFDDIFKAQNVISQPEFLLYLTGYAQFFNLNDDWCDSWSFSVRPFPFDRPPLTHDLRADINGLVTKVNNIYEQIFVTIPTKTYGSSTLTRTSTGTGFVKPAAIGSINIATRTYGSGIDTDFEKELQTFSSNNTSITIPGSIGKVANGFALRPFHPKIDGHTGIKDAITAQMKIDNIPRAPAAASATIVPPASPTPPPPPPYATGTCSFHLDEYQDCTDNTKNLYATITMHDNEGKVIGQIPVDPNAGPIRQAINDKDPYSFKSALSYPMLVIGEHQKDYNFTLETWLSQVGLREGR